jgi:hypothetical protein
MAQEDDRRTAASLKHPAHLQGPQAPQAQTPSANDLPRRTEDGGYAYIFDGPPSDTPPWRAIVKTKRPLSTSERSGMLDRLKIECPSTWSIMCAGKLDDGMAYTSERLAEQ